MMMKSWCENFSPRRKGGISILIKMFFGKIGGGGAEKKTP